MIELKYGPQTYQIEKLLLKIESLTPEQIKELDGARAAVRYSAWHAAQNNAQNIAWHAAQSTAWDTAWYGARDTVRYADRDFVWRAILESILDSAWTSTWEAIVALIVRDLIGEKFTQEHYDILTKPWRDVMGEFEEPEEGE